MDNNLFDDLRNDEEYLDALTDESLRGLIEYINKSSKPMKDGDMIVRMTNVKRTEAFHSAFNVMKQIIRGKDVMISEISHQPILSASTISITGRDIRITRPDALSSVLKVASNAEILSKTDGSVEINITFYDVLFELKDDKSDKE